jgi:glutamine amidotransferase-like uncharacterized protein
LVKYVVFKPTIALYQHHPEASRDCGQGIILSMADRYNIVEFAEQDCTDEFLSKVDLLAFPGGIGDADKYYEFFRRKTANRVADFIDRGGRYLGICMGAYWAGLNYFDILDGADAVQYIKQPTADIRRSYGTVAPVTWNNTGYNMYFYDGCTFTGNNFETVARYANGDPMAIRKGSIGLIGCHPESQEYWYDKPYLKGHWHNGQHNRLLLNFVDQLML